MANAYELRYVRNLLTPDEQSFLYSSIDKLKDEGKEWTKIDVLVETPSYVDFLAQASGRSHVEIKGYLRDYQSDKKFQEEFAPKLDELGTIANAGDLRFHAVTLYTLVRALKPTIMIETGVAQGKSSAIILLAMHHNNAGALTSIDLPNPSGQQLPDGAFTSTGSRDVGWMVPDYLRKRWSLILGDSRAELPVVVGRSNGVDIFFHDSLHTYDHVKFEIDTATSRMKSGLVVVDNLETEAGKYFEEFAKTGNYKAFAYSNLGVIRVQNR